MYIYIFFRDFGETTHVTCSNRKRARGGGRGTSSRVVFAAGALGRFTPVSGEGLDVFRPGLFGLGTPAKATARHDDDDVPVPSFTLSTTPSNVKPQKK